MDLFQGTFEEINECYETKITLKKYCLPVIAVGEVVIVMIRGD